MKKKTVHFADSYLLQPTNAIKVNLIGAGGTGSAMLTALARINHSLKALGHAGLQVHVFDADVITHANLGRQLFSTAELGLNKSVALINRINRFFGTNWKAIPQMYGTEQTKDQHRHQASITVSCVDTIAARFRIANMLRELSASTDRDKPLYWMDFGNGQHTGQVILSTVGHIKQPNSKKFEAVGLMPFITEEYAALFEQADEDALPSCSLAEALTKQDLFINSALADLGASLLWQLFREGIIHYRGFFLNLKDFRSQPVAIA